jgi:16S rRNA (adenine1518-N6/adenine1519-N6)-dimethyltransferase
VTDFPRTTRALREAMAARGVAPKKVHGQCFLTDAQAVDAIVRDAEVTAEDFVVEVGTGTGLLTHALAETGARVETFDLDASVQDVARSLREWPDRVRFRLADALEGKHALSAPLLEALARARAEAGPGRAKFVSNLPYNAATPVLLGLLALPDPPDVIVGMVQNEVGEKLLAGAGHPEYGPPSVLRALAAEGKILRRFPPQVFWPAPSVRSALLRLVPRRPRGLRSEETPAFAAFLTAVFSRRRKVLSTGLAVARPELSPAAAAAACEAVGLSPRARPEDADPAALLALFRRTEAGSSLSISPPPSGAESPAGN